MAISQAMCTSFKVQLLNGIHAFSTTVARGNTNADSFKLALYTSSASLGAGTTAFLDFNDLTISTATITARGALIYNDTQGDKAVAVLDFGADKTSTAGDFTVVFPAADASNAIIRIA
tara:strand:+ start:78 stop:431 length:354 start_codon:yes stop_codon:yes gene_type:complete